MKIKNIILNHKPIIVFCLVIVALSIIITLANYIRVPISGSEDLVKYLIHFGLVSSALIGVMLLISSHKTLVIILSPIVLIGSIASSMCLYLYNITITSEIVEVILKTDWSVTKEFINPSLITGLLICLILTTLVIRYRLKLKVNLKESGIMIVLSVLMILPAIIVDNKRNNTIGNRAPFSIILAVKEYRQAIKQNNTPRSPIAKDAIFTGSDSLLIVLVLGESLRSDHLGINGYHRNTTPLLQNREIYTFKQNKSLNTYTASSIPQILTRADKSHPERAYHEKSVISIFKSCGYHTSWLANQIPDYTYSSIAKNCDTYLQFSGHATTYSDIISTDQNILSNLAKHLDINRSKPELLVLHTMGSHWYYNYRCPKEMREFHPITTSRSFSNNSKEEMINSYDNSVLFTDYFIDNTIKHLEDREVILIYTSDHGESLGEDDRWLHAFEHETLYNAACFVWMSELYQERNKKSAALIQNMSKETNTSAIFHTLLDAGQITTKDLMYHQSLLSKTYKID